MSNSSNNPVNSPWGSEWEQFKDDLLYYWRSSKYPVPEILIDWGLARRHLKAYHCTGAEHAKFQIGMQLNDRSSVNVHKPFRSRDDDNDNGCKSNQPLKPSPLPTES